MRSQSEAVEDFEKNLIGEHFYFGILLDLACVVQVGYSQLSKKRSVRTLAPSAMWPAEKRYGATELPGNFVPRRPSRFGRYATNRINRGDNAPWGQLRPSFDHCEFVSTIIYLY
jgi:hypothetical protein